MLYPNGSGGGGIISETSVTGTLSTQLQRGAAIELLLSLGLRGTWVSNVLRGGTSESSVTIEKKLAAAAMRRVTGATVTSTKIEAEYNKYVSVAFDFMGMTYPTATTAITGAVYTPAPAIKGLNGKDVSAISIAGLSGLTYTKMNLTIEQPRESIHGFGSEASQGIAANAGRKITGTISFLRENFTPETTITPSNNVHPMAFTVGSGAQGVTILIPAAACKLPQDQHDGAKNVVDVEFTAQWDATEGTDIKITRLS
ncbi:hypothetical protein ASE85_03270 [Sphingobium sp. Leaf26]|nr:hypothetical protein ASE85_03270 [Sphingobium sp. Leaf26]